MPELPKVSQDFEADATAYLAAIEEMIAKNEDLINSIRDVQAAIDGLHGKDIKIELNEDDVLEQVAYIRELLDGIPDEKTIRINTIYAGGTGAPGNAGDASAINDLTDALNRNAEAWSRVETVERDYSVMMAQTIADANEASGALDRAFAVSSEGIAEVQSATEAVKNFNDGLEQMANAWKRVGTEADADAARLSASMQEAAAAANETSGALDRVFAVSSEGTAEMKTATEAVKDFDAGLDLIRAGAPGGADDLALLSAALGRVVTSSDGAVTVLGSYATAAKDADTATKTIAGTALASVAGFTAFGLSLTQLHWIVMGTVEAIATLLPAAIALGTGLLAGAEGATWIADKLQGVYTASEATSQMLGVTSGQALGLKSTLQQAQTAADPGVYELLGSALNGAKTSFFNFGAEGVSVIHMLDQFAAKIDVELAGAVGQQLHTMLGTGVSDLQAWGSALGNIGHFILNLASEMPGLAEVLIHVVSGFTGLLSAVSGAAPGLITFAMGLEETWRWGGLVASVVGIAVSALGNFAGVIAKAAGSLALMGDVSKFTSLRVALTGVDAAAAETATTLESVAGVLAGPWGWVIAGAALGLGLLIDKLVTSQTAAQAWAASMESAINKANFTQGLADILADLPKVNQELTQTAQGAGQFAAQARALGGGARTGAVGLNALHDSQNALQQAQQQLIGQAVNILGMNTKIDGSYYSLNEAMALASAAGLTVGQAFNKQGQLTQVAQQQIANLVEGYKQMDQTGSVLSNDINAINEQMLMQQTKVQSLNQAWDGFISNMTGVSSSVAGLYNNLAQLGNLAPTIGSKITAFSGKTGQSIQQIAGDLKTFNASSAQTWSAWDSAIGQANTAIDSFRTAAAAGGVSQQQYGEAIKGVIAQMLPYAKDSQTATSMLSALAQEAGGPTTSNFSTLSQWVGNTGTATKNLNSIVQTATQYMANLSQAASNLSSTMDSAVAGAITQGTINIKGIATATQTLTTDFQKNAGQLTGSTTPALQAWATQLHNSGTPLTDAKAMLDQLLTRMGATPGAVAAANAALSSYYGSLDKTASSEQNAASWARTLASAIGSIPKNTTVTVTTRYITEGGGASMGINPSALIPPKTAGLAGGGHIPGYGGGDIVPALLEPGETVVSKEHSKALAGAFRAAGVPGYASGGNVANQAAAAAQNAAMIAAAFPNAPIPAPAAAAPQFLGEWLPSSMIGAAPALPPASSGGGTPTGGGDTTGHPHSRHDWWHGDDHDRDLHSHITINLDGRKIWEGQQKTALRYGLRNNGIATGLWKPQ